MATHARPINSAASSTKVVLFDLDNTLFDHHHSLRSAISAVQEKYPSLTGYTMKELVAKYNDVLQRAYDQYLAKSITYDETDGLKVRLFLTELGLPEPTPEEITEFRAVYKPAYRASRRATPGSIETLVRLRDAGYRLAIVTNGQKEDQAAKAERIGVLHLVDRIFTSEEAGYTKPDHRIFQLAMCEMEASPRSTLMVGDSIESDIKGALGAGLSAILYSPTARESRRVLFGREVPVIQEMHQLTVHLGISSHRFDT
ncbi:HAD-like protein [Coniochaeta sp. PMI_546]|nr:HAD-like protein [Coniochaeta sp. PMI_546]